MTNSNSHVNGASLEDCHTNFFALTDLCGIKWRSYRVEHALTTEPLDDPVVLSCSQCVAHDVLAVWRRVQLSNPPASPSEPSAPFQSPPSCPVYKELWVFWYGDEPEFHNLLAPQLQRHDEGNWESGLSYESRSLLFKALHKFIERCLLSRGFVKIGKWFTQPYTNNDRARCKNNSTNLSFAFSFFVHGESTVCASVQTRLNLPLRRLSRAHLAAGSSHTVLLAPHGLAGRLTGASWRTDSPGVRRLLDMWGQLYPLDSRLTAALQAGREPLVPPLVEVVVGDVRMKYLSCYVLVCDSDFPASSSAAAQQPAAPLSPGPTLVTAGQTGSATDPSAPFLASTHPLLAGCDEHTRRLSATIVARVRHQAAVGVPLAPGGLAMGLLRSGRPVAGGEGSADSLAESLGHWDFTDPGQRTACSCPACRRKLRHKQQQTTNKRPEKERPPRIKVGAWHRRPPPAPLNTDGLVSSGLDRLVRSPQRPPPPAYYRAGAAPCSSYVVDSPASIGQSPLATPHSNQSLLCAGEVAPSPHPATPRTPSAGALPASGGPGSCAPASSAATPVSSAPVYSPYLKAPSSQQALSTSPCRAESPPAASAAASSTTATTSSLPTSEWRQWPAPPRLPSPRPLDDPLPDRACNLYNFSDLQLWLKCPLKKERDLELLLQQKDAGHTTGDRAFSADPLTNNCGVKVEGGYSRGVKRTADPYEFDDDPTTARVSTPLDSEVKPEAGVSRSRPASEDSLFTSAGLQPKLADLENLFDDRDSDDGATGDLGSVSAPVGSVSPVCTTGSSSVQFSEESGGTATYSGPSVGAAPSSGYGGTSVRVGSKSLPSAASALTSVELSKIYPTPPSHEHNHNPSTSPLCQSDSNINEMGADQYMTSVAVKQEPGVQQVPPGSPDPLLTESLECAGSVYRPVAQCVLFSSARYAPLTSLPSQCLPGLGLPPSYRPSWLAGPPSTAGATVCSTSPAAAIVSPAASRLPSVRHSSVTGVVHAGPTVQPPLGSGGHGRPGVSPIYDNPGSLKSVGPASVGAAPRSVGSGIHSDSLLSPVSPFVGARHANPADPAGAHTVEVPALLFNVLLEDSLLSLFHDHNFDMCTMCVCNASADRVGNICGREASLYIPTSGGALLGSRQRGAPALKGPVSSFSDEPTTCRCGYSAVVSRRLAYRSGLFAEDEVELTGDRREVRYEPQRPPLSALLRGAELPPEAGLDVVGLELLQLLRLQSSSWPALATDLPLPPPDSPLPPQQQLHGQHKQLSYLQFCDGSEVVRSAVDMLRTTVSPLSSGQQAATVAATVAAVAAGVDLRVHWPLHQWPFSLRPSPHCNQDVVRVMRALQPLLQDAVQKRRQTKLWESTYQVSGPLTWRQFHRLAGRGTDDHCSPQPVPTLLVGHEGEWLATSPFSLRHWHGLLLEPVSSPRHVAYLVVTPAGDNEFVLARVRDFFRELSSTYQACQLGRHGPLGSQLPDGVLRINRTAAVKLANLSVDAWFNQLGDSQLAVKLKLYAQYCLHYVGPYLQTLMESSSTVTSSVLRDRSTNSPMPPPATPDAPSTPKQIDDDGVGRAGDHPSSVSNSSPPSYSSTRQQHQEHPHMVLYFVDPFSYGAESSEMSRLVNLAMMRAYLHMRSSLPQHMQRNINLQVVSLQSILTAGLDVESYHQRAQLRSLALSVYSQCASQPYQHLSANSLTGFGPSANTHQLLKGKQEPEYDVRTSPLYSSALCVLAPLPDPQRETDVLSSAVDATRTLFCAYCLTADQNWLLASCTDARGLLRCSTAINVRIPNRLRRRKVSARRLSVQKLMDWLAGIMVQAMHPWRLVVGRLGRIGHGELKSWSSVLSRRSLTRFTNQLRELCGRCSSAGTGDVCSVLSACLVSLEPDPCHCVLADQCSPDDPPTGSGAFRLSTPHDVTCTHIMVFPTSATTQCAQTAFQQEHISALGTEFIEDDFLDVINDDDDVLGNNLFDEFNWEDNDMDADRAGPVSGAGGPLGVGSLAAGVGPGGGVGDCGGVGGVGVSGAGSGAGVGPSGLFGPGALESSGDAGRSGPGEERAEDIGSVLQQPLALGYMPSTARIGAVPDWFWANAEAARQRHVRGQGPVFLRAALHLHCQTHCSDDVLQQQQSQSRGHPLDSDTTTDVLRYVLENYNRLSWLAMDPASHDRRSCLPIHMQLLLQLYNGISSVV